ncbi:MAG: EF-P lysine aminoacylase GenX [Desulfobulbaceae bacterium]|nr:MAG: EF-P lysine aminoacylase GenX [Desulfobulbaceae bacterium]
MLTREGLQLRAALLHSIRSFFRSQQFLEVDTPVRQPVVIPESTIDHLPSGEWYLQSSPEQAMKRLLAAGSGNIFQLAPCFRRGERGQRHLEEFLMLEWYRMDADYDALMQDCRDLIITVVAELSGEPSSQKLIADSALLKKNLQQPWQRVTVHDGFLRYCPVSVEEALATGCFDEMLVEYLEPNLGVRNPEFLVDYPLSQASLARKKAGDNALAERFELYCDGVELANGFSELTDSSEQRIRFEEELERSGDDFSMMPERFLKELDKIDRAAGIAFGVDRFLMLLMAAPNIEDVVSMAPSDWF